MKLKHIYLAILINYLIVLSLGEVLYRITDKKDKTILYDFEEGGIQMKLKVKNVIQVPSKERPFLWSKRVIKAHTKKEISLNPIDEIIPYRKKDPESKEPYNNGVYNIELDEKAFYHGAKRIVLKCDYVKNNIDIHMEDFLDDVSFWTYMSAFVRIADRGILKHNFNLRLYQPDLNKVWRSGKGVINDIVHQMFITFTHTTFVVQTSEFENTEGLPLLLQEYGPNEKLEEFKGVTYSVHYIEHEYLKGLSIIPLKGKTIARPYSIMLEYKIKEEGSEVYILNGHFLKGFIEFIEALKDKFKLPDVADKLYEDNVAIINHELGRRNTTTDIEIVI
jgi:hypothetical protein